MATSNRAALLTKMHKVLKKHYQPFPSESAQPLLEQLLFALCLENTRYEPAQAAYNALRTTFFDWNEVRVSSIKELSEVLRELPDPAAAATNVRGVLQSVFESTYSFDLESWRKLTQGQALQKLEKLAGASPFALAVITQGALGGHAIPVDRGTLHALCIVGFITEAQQAAGEAPGMERAIPKNKGVEFSSLLHQLGADLIGNPYAPALHKILLEINPEAKARLPKRQPKKPAEPPPAPPAKRTRSDATSSPSGAKKKPASEASRSPAKKDSRPAREPQSAARGKSSAASPKRKPR
jgi:endonuclease III